MHLPPSPVISPSRPGRFRRAAALLGSAALLAGLLAACSDSEDTASGSGAAGSDCITDFDENTDYYPDKLSVDFAQNFDLDYRNSYVVAHVAGATVDVKDTFVFLHCGAPEPELTGDLTDATVIEAPVSSLFLNSTTQLAALDELGQLDVVTGFGNSDYVYDEDIAKAVAPLPQFAATSEADAELVVSAHPQLLITDYAADRSLGQIEKAGVPVMINSDWLETDPLGRAEWIKLYAALTNTEAAASTFFDQVVRDFQAAQELTTGVSPVDAVVGLPYQGTWYVPGGASYNAAMMKAAGITFAGADDTSTGSIVQDIDTQYSQSGHAPLALSSESVTSLADAIGTDPRIAQFAAYRDGNAWAASAQLNDAGSNNFYELGAIRPDLILADLIAIAHPELMPDHEFTFYRKLE